MKQGYIGSYISRVISLLQRRFDKWQFCWLLSWNTHHNDNQIVHLNKMTPQSVVIGVPLEKQNSSLVLIKPAGKPFALVFSRANELETLHQQPWENSNRHFASSSQLRVDNELTAVKTGVWFLKTSQKSLAFCFVFFFFSACDLFSQRLFLPLFPSVYPHKGGCARDVREKRPHYGCRQCRN